MSEIFDKQALVGMFGSLKAVGEAAGCSKQAVSRWKTVPVARAREIEIRTAGRVRAWQIRPDFFPRPDEAA